MTRHHNRNLCRGDNKRIAAYNSINERCLERLTDMLMLSRASRVPIENLACDELGKLAAPVRLRRPKRRLGKIVPDSSDF
jgi:hypothetical protein